MYESSQNLCLDREEPFQLNVDRVLDWCLIRRSRIAQQFLLACHTTFF